ncbi:MAG: hypothetical protein IPJ65_37940 [Archangiaceae bacterium]|nr:hypothetical protein [Archangiaceae bacterium]
MPAAPAAPKRLRISTTVVSPEGRASLEHNAERVARACELIRSHSGRTDLVVLPAGYLLARDGDDVGALVRPLIDQARRAKLAVVVGIDAAVKGRQKAPLPYFLVGWSPGMKKASIWRQRSVTSHDALSVSDADAAEPRVLSVAGRRVAPLACGEVFNPRIRDAIAGLRPSVAVLAAHTAAGARHWAGQRCLARLGVPSVRAVHAATAARQVMCHPVRERPARWSQLGSGIEASCFEL